MTKELEELFVIAYQAISTLGRFNGGNNESLAIGALMDIQRKLEEYVVIKSGSSRHPYADVLHEWIEGAKVELKTFGHYGSVYEWHDFTPIRHLGELRIKPQEPVYEWQWCMKLNEGEDWFMSEYLTDEEITSRPSPHWLLKIDETKRVRQ